MAESNGEMSEDDIIINDQDGLPNVHPNLFTETEVENTDFSNDDDFEGLPTSLIVTNIHDNVFSSPGTKKQYSVDCFNLVGFCRKET